MERRLTRPALVGFFLSICLLFPTAGNVSAKWPPFDLQLSPRFSDGIITYTLRLVNSSGAEMRDVTIKVPLPAGTEFLEGKSVFPGVDVTFDGAEVTIRVGIVHNVLTDVSFSVRIVDPSVTVFTTHPWISWSGTPSGDYLGGDVVTDLEKTPLDWTAPYPFLDLAASAVVDGNTITYSIYPRNVGWLRMWDLAVNVPLPEGTKYVSAQAPGEFTAGFDGREVHFTAIELPQGLNMEPLRMTVSTDGITDGMIVTRAWASWKNEGWGVGTDYSADEALATGWIVVQPGVPQLVVVDLIDDVPFEYYDLTSISFQPDGDSLKVNLFTVGDFADQSDPVEFVLYIDSDCQPDTGRAVAAGVGAEYAAGFVSSDRSSYLNEWDATTAEWVTRNDVFIPAAVGESGNALSLWLPLALIRRDGRLCWSAEAISWNSGNYTPYPQPDEIVFVKDAVIQPDLWWPTSSAGLQAPLTGNIPQAAAAPLSPALPDTGQGDPSVPVPLLAVLLNAAVAGVVVWQAYRAIRASI